MLLIEWCVQNGGDCYRIQAAVFRVEVKIIFKKKSEQIRYEDAFIGLFDCQSMVHYDFIPRGQTVNLEFLVFYGFFEKKFKTNDWNFSNNTASFFTVTVLLQVQFQKFLTNNKLGSTATAQL
jgi:hypothetical protein